MFLVNWFKRYPSTLFILMAMTVFGLVAAGLILQMKDPVFVIPCHLCVFQRYLYLFIGGFALIAAFAAAKSKKTIRLFSVIILAISAFGAYVAATQSWMQMNRPTDGYCGVKDGDFYSFFVEGSPLKEIFPMLFRGEGNCYDPGWVFLNLSIANWSFIAFTCCVISMIFMFIWGGKGRYRLFN